MRTACKPRTAPLVRASSRVASRGAGALPQGSAACSAAERRRAAVRRQSMAGPESHVLDGASLPRACAPHLPASREPACSLPQGKPPRASNAPPPFHAAVSEAGGSAALSPAATMLTLTARARARPRVPCALTLSLFQVVGASGDLAKKKIFPALFALYYGGMLPQARALGARRRARRPASPPTNFSRFYSRASSQDFVVLGFARSAMTHDQFRELICDNLTCRVDRKCASPARARSFAPPPLLSLRSRPSRPRQGHLRARAGDFSVPLFLRLRPVRGA